MYEGSVLIGYFLGVHVHLAMSDIRSEIIALCCSLCVCVCIDIYVSKECKNITLPKLLSSLVSKCVFVTAQTCIFMSAEHGASV